MTEGPRAAADEPEALDTEAARRRREEIFGDVLPEGTSDDRDTESGGGRSRDDWFRDNVPPHH